MRSSNAGRCTTPLPKATVDTNTISESDLSDVFDLMAAELSHARNGLIILPQKEHGMSLIMGDSSKKHWKDMLANGSKLKNEAHDALTKQFEGLVLCSGGSGSSSQGAAATYGCSDCGKTPVSRATWWGHGKSPDRST